MLNLVASIEQHYTASELNQNSPDPTLTNHLYYFAIIYSGIPVESVDSDTRRCPQLSDIFLAII